MSSKQFLADNQAELAGYVETLSIVCHGLAKEAGWYNDIHTGHPIEINTSQAYMCIQSEVFEAFEGARKNLMDEHLPYRKMEEVELADTVIRILNYAKYRGFDIGGALVEKLAYNITRPDHQIENRLLTNGKKF